MRPIRTPIALAVLSALAAACSSPSEGVATQSSASSASAGGGGGGGTTGGGTPVSPPTFQLAPANDFGLVDLTDAHGGRRTGQAAFTAPIDGDVTAGFSQPLGWFVAGIHTPGTGVQGSGPVTVHAGERVTVDYILQPDLQTALGVLDTHLDVRLGSSLAWVPLKATAEILNLSGPLVEARFTDVTGQQDAAGNYLYSDGIWGEPVSPLTFTFALANLGNVPAQARGEVFADGQVTAYGLRVSCNNGPGDRESWDYSLTPGQTETVRCQITGDDAVSPPTVLTYTPGATFTEIRVVTIKLSTPTYTTSFSIPVKFVPVPQQPQPQPGGNGGGGGGGGGPPPYPQDGWYCRASNHPPSSNMVSVQGMCNTSACPDSPCTSGSGNPIYNYYRFVNGGDTKLGKTIEVCDGQATPPGWAVLRNSWYDPSNHCYPDTSGAANVMTFCSSIDGTDTPCHCDDNPGSNKPCTQPATLPPFTWSSSWDDAGLAVSAGSVPLATNWGAGSLFAFVRSGTTLVQLAGTGFSAAGSTTLVTGPLASDPSGMGWGAQYIDMAWRDPNSELSHFYWSGGGWAQESLGGFIAGKPTIVIASDGSRGDVFARAGWAPNQLWHRAWVGLANDWQNWEALPFSVDDDPSVVSDSPGRTEVFYRAANGNVNEVVWDGTLDGTRAQAQLAGAVWTTRPTLGGLTAGAPAVASQTPGDIEVYSVDGWGAHSVWSNSSSDGGATWAGWTARPGMLSQNPAVSLTASTLGQMDLFVAQYGNAELEHDAYRPVLTTGATSAPIGQ